MRLKLPYAPKIPRIRHRGLLVAASLGLQILILAAVWLLTFRGVRHSLTQSVRDYVVRENAKLVDRLALEFPDDGVEPRYGTPEWDQWQHIIETTGVSLAAGGFACLLDEDGNILCHPDMRHDQSLRKVNLGGDLLRTSSADRTLREIGDSETISGEMSFLAEGTHYVATRRIPGTRYLLLMHQPEASLARAGNDITTNVVGSGLIAISAVLLLSGGGLWTLVRRYDSVFEELNRRMKGDLQIARQIQQATIPSELPAAPGFEIAGWSEPAEETGGDTFDVIGLNRSNNGWAITNEEPERIILLLADATGHGIGPALAVSELRAMLRMSAQVEDDLEKIASQINEQLYADLPDGRFITGWIGALNVGAAKVHSMSAGQAPILIWRAATGEVQQFAADTVPFGVLDELIGAEQQRWNLEPGDVLLVVSDGIHEAPNASGDRFGIERLIELLRRHGAQSADTISTAIRGSLAGYEMEDDRTVLVVKRACW